MTQRLYIEGSDKAAIMKGLVWLAENSVKTRRGFVAIPRKQDLVQGKGLYEVLGARISESLKRDGYAQLDDAAAKLELVIENGYTLSCESSPILAIYPTRKFLNQIDSIPNTSAILVVPWSKMDIEEWIKIWDTTELSSQKVNRRAQMKDESLKEAVRRMAISVNRTSRLSSIGDRRSIAKGLKLLKDGGMEFDPVEIKSYLVNEADWDAVNAEEFAKVAREAKVDRMR